MNKLIIGAMLASFAFPVFGAANAALQVKILESVIGAAPTATDYSNTITLTVAPT